MASLGRLGVQRGAVVLTACLLAWGCVERGALVTTAPGTGGGGARGLDGGDDGSARQSNADANADADHVLEACPTTVSCVPDCRGMPPCWKTCGPARSGRRDCTCDAATGLLVCTACTYDPAQDTSCFALPDPVPACPTGAQGSAPCQLEPCHPCGSSTGPGYLDSSGAPKAGFCVCWLYPESGLMLYTCASPADWPSEVQASPPEDEVIQCQP